MHYSDEEGFARQFPLNKNQAKKVLLFIVVLCWVAVAIVRILGLSIAISVVDMNAHLRLVLCERGCTNLYQRHGRA